MTIQRPERHWIERELIRVLEALFVGAIGFMASQFLAIPSQQVHQDDRLNAIEKHMEYEDMRLGRLETQHEVMLRQLDELKKLHESPTTR